MGTKYSSQTQSGYNASPPPDDGSTGSNNQVTWAKHKTKLGDPVLTLAQNINSALLTALDFSSRTTAVNDSPAAADHMRTVECTATLTVSLPDATTIAKGYIVGVYNNSTGIVTVGLTTGTDTLNGTANGTFTLQGGQSAIFKTNNSANGYFTYSYVPGSGQATATNRQTLLMGPADISGFPSFLPKTATGLNITTVNIAAEATLTGNVTTTVASPGVVGWSGHTLVIGQAVSFTTNGALPTGLTSGTTYYVISSGFSGTQFEVAATPGGAAINFTGSTSGQSVCWAGEQNNLVATAISGVGLYGQTNVVGIASSNLTWTGLTDNTTNHLYVLPSAGLLTTGFTTSAPVVTYENVTSPSVSSGQITINMTTGKTYLGNGTSAVVTPLVIIGTATTSSGNITATIAYNYGVSSLIAPGGLIKFTTVTASTTFIPTSFTNKIVAMLAGGGGAGGGAHALSGSSTGLGGHSGQVKWITITAPIAASYSLTIGAGGTGVSDGNGNTGGSTTGFGSTAQGGLGGYADVLTSSIGLSGETGLDRGGDAISSQGNGNAAGANSNAGGGAAYSTGSTYAGGSGGSGLIYIWEFA